MRKILITGGLGFIGFHLIGYLLKRHSDLNITVVDNLSSSKINFGPEYAKLNVIIKDLLETEELDDDYSDIYHLASPVGSLGILSKNGYVAKNIIDLTYRIIEIAFKCNSKLLYVSSSEIYGHSGVHDEEDTKVISGVIGTRTEYSLGKITSEVILKNININRTLNYNIVRPFNVIGEQQSSQIGFVLPTFFENALRNESIPVFYDGSQRRSFCHVEDIVKAIVSVQESNICHDVFNIGHNGNITTIADLAKRIKKMSNSKSEIINVDPVQRFGKCYIEAFDKIPNIDRISSKLGWKPEIDLESALERVYQFYKNS